MKQLLLFFFVISCALVNAQSIYMGGGYSIPSGSFSNAVSTVNDGFAKSGNYFSLSIYYPVKNKLFLYVETGISSQGIQGDNLAKATGSSQGIVTVNVKEKWKANTTLAGLGFMLPRGRWNYGVRLMAGFITLNSPDYVTVYVYPSNTGADLHQSEAVSSLAFALGISVSYDILENFVLTAGLDNVNSSFHFKRNYNSSNQQFNDVNYEVFRPGLSLGYRF